MSSQDSLRMDPKPSYLQSKRDLANNYTTGEAKLTFMNICKKKTEYAHER